MISPLSMPWW
jgi:hypothetical protein